MEKVLVTGGSGLIGVEVVRQLCQQGLRPRVIVRRPHRAALLRPYDIEPISGDLGMPDSLPRAVQGVDTVLHLGGRATFERYSRLAPTLVHGTTALAEAAAAAGVEQFVFASSALVYDSAATPIDRDTIAHPQLDYGRAKVEAEARLAQISDRTGLGVANLRLPHVYGPQSILFQQIRRGIAVFPGTMTNKYSHLHVEDAARVMIAAARSRWAGTAPIADGYNATFSEFFDIVTRYQPGLRVIRVPQHLGYVGTAVLEPLLSRHGRPTLLSPGTVVSFNLSLPMSTEPTWRELGLTPVYPTIAEGIPASLDGYVQFLWRHPAYDHRRS